MNRLVHLAILCCIIGLVSSCEKDPFLSLNSPNTITFSEQGGTQKVSFTTNRDWTVSSSESWCMVSPSSGLKTDGEISISITCGPNTTYDPRNAMIIITSEGQVESIAIAQDSNLGILVDKWTYSLNNKAQLVEIELRSNTDYSVEIEEGSRSWISVSKTKALSSEMLMLNIAANKDINAREGKLKITQTNGNLSQTITILQAEGDMILVDKDSYGLSYKAQDFVIDVVSNVDYSIYADVDWLSVSDYGSSSASYTVSVLENNDDTHYRVGHIVLSSIGGDISTTATVFQDRAITGQFYSIEPHFSESMDLMSLIWRLAGAPEYNECRITKVSESADAFFASVRDHKAVRLAKEYRNKGVSYDAVATYGLYLLITNDGSIIFNPFFEGSNNSNLKRWSGNSKEDMLVALNDFYQKANYNEWYQSLEPLRQQAIDSFKSKFDIDYNWFNLLFGPIDNLSTQIILSFLNGPSNYGLSTELSYGGSLHSPVIGCINQDNNGNIYYSDVLSVIIHEFSHPYCNPLVDKYWESMKDKANALFPKVESLLKPLAYSNSKSMMYETLVRACTIRYLIAHGYSRNKERMIQNEESIGFLLVRCIVDALEIREQNWSKYPTLDDFMPEIVKAINDYQL